ncbi:MAG: hypothetical protein E7677_06525 [Ruminococcaceae bacterium]|nr:hypothetical protein [Oscillospiraceae bacterium]
MAKKYTWKITESVESGESVEHTVKLTCSFITGKALINIDGDEYDISVKPFSLRGTSQVFRLGEEAAVVEFPKKGEPRVLVEGELIPSV